VTRYVLAETSVPKRRLFGNMLTTLSRPGTHRFIRKSFYTGTHRVIAPESTVENVCRLAPVMGITRIANVTGLDTIGIPVVMVCRPNSRSIAVSQGKGLTVAAAKASGLMESVEGYHAECMTLPLKLASYEELRYTHNVANATCLPRPTNGIFHPNLQLLWIEGHDLLQDTKVWVPYELVHLNHTLPLPPGTGCFISSSNGLASGNDLLEAISHGICEVVERDATTLWSLKGSTEQEKTRIDLNSVDDRDCQTTIEKYRRADVCVAVWETTSDIRIPAFLCLASERTINPLRLLPSGLGFGCHPSRPIALLRSLTEAAQSRLTYISGSRDDLGRTAYEHSLSPNVLQQDFMRTEVQGQMRSYCGAPSFNGATFNEDIAWELDRLHSAGIASVVVVDLTKPELGLPVVRVVIPGLEPKDSIAHHVLGPRALAIMANQA
jgi:YcaO-like protein with predicted kinase domain